MNDYLQHPELIPEEIKRIINSFSPDEYIGMQDLKMEIESRGWTFDYDLDCQPFNLMPLE